MRVSRIWRVALGGSFLVMGLGSLVGLAVSGRPPAQPAAPSAQPALRIQAYSLIPASSRLYGRSTPRGVAWSPDGDLYVADSNTTADGTASIQAIGERSGELRRLWWFDRVRDPAGTQPRLKSPVSVAVEPRGIWVTDSDTGLVRLLSYDSARKEMVVARQVNFRSPELRLTCPTDMVLNASRGIYVLDGRAGAIVRLGSGETARAYPTPEARSADGLGVSADGESLLVAVGQEGSVLRIPLDAAGDPLPGKSSWAATGLERPTDVAAGPDGTLWVTEPDNHRVVGIPKGATRPTTQLRIDLPGRAAPWSISIRNRGRGVYEIALADVGTGQVVVAQMPTRTPLE